MPKPTSNRTRTTVLFRLQIREYGGDGPHPAPGSRSLGLQPDALEVANPGATDPGAPSFTWEPDDFRRRVLLGQTDLASSDLVDEMKSGAGIVADVISDPAGPFKGGIYSKPNAGCMTFVRELQKKIFPEQPVNADRQHILQPRRQQAQPGPRSRRDLLGLAPCDVGTIASRLIAIEGRSS